MVDKHFTKCRQCMDEGKKSTLTYRSEEHFVFDENGDEIIDISWVRIISFCSNGHSSMKLLPQK